MRLDKFLAQSSVGKRKEVRIYIKEGKVKVNGEIVLIPAIEINEKEDIIEHLGKRVEYTEKVYYMFNKPMGCVTAKSDREHKTVFDYFSEEDKKGLFHVGRLDKDTEGLLILTNDGEFEHRLMHPDNKVNKKYYFWALGSLSEEDIKSLEKGVYIIKGEVLTSPSKVEIEHQGSYREFKDEIEKSCKKEMNYGKEKVVSGYITISEGRKHQVKRMLKAVGCNVVYLKRVAIGSLELDNKLSESNYKKLSELEIKMINRSL